MATRVPDAFRPVKLLLSRAARRLESSQVECKRAGGPVPTGASSIADFTSLPKRIVLTGFMGAGKSAVGARLARELGWTFVDLDAEIVRSERKTIAEIFEASGEAAFREMEQFALTDALRSREIVLALGGGALESAANRQMLAGDPETLLVYLEAPLDVLLDRCAQQNRDQAEAPRRPVLENRAELAGRFLRRRPLYESAHLTIATADCGLEEVVRRIAKEWKQAARRHATIDRVTR